MIAIPSVDLQNGQSLQAAAPGGDVEAPAGLPVVLARAWADLGFRMLHVLDLENPGPPMLARIMNARIENTPSLVYHYEDPQAGHYIVEVSTLRYFQVVNTEFLAA